VLSQTLPKWDPVKNPDKPKDVRSSGRTKILSENGTISSYGNAAEWPMMP